MTRVDSIRAVLKRTGRAVLASGRAYAFVRARALRNDPVTVLTYHALGADDEDFDAWTVVRRQDFLRQLAFVRAHYDVVSMDDAVLERKGDSHGARPQAVITFDDGHASLHRHLLPIVEREQVPVTVFVATGHIEAAEPYWFDRVMNALQTIQPLAIDLRDAGLGSWDVGVVRGERNWQAISGVLQALKSLAPDRRDVLCRRIVEQTLVAARPAFAPLFPLTIEQLKELGRSPYVTIAAHTHCHSLLDRISLDAARETIEHSRSLLRIWTGQRVDHFAYPNGNHNAALEREVEQLGFATAFTAHKGLWQRSDMRYAAMRIPIGRYDDLDKFKLNLLGGVWPQQLSPMNER